MAASAVHAHTLSPTLSSMPDSDRPSRRWATPSTWCGCLPSRPPRRARRAKPSPATPGADAHSSPHAARAGAVADLRARAGGHVTVRFTGGRRVRGVDGRRRGPCGVRLARRRPTGASARGLSVANAVAIGRDCCHVMSSRILRAPSPQKAGSAAGGGCSAAPLVTYLVTQGERGAPAQLCPLADSARAPFCGRFWQPRATRRRDLHEDF